MELTHSLEDYLEAILIINREKKVVRVKDIMKYFGYKVSSVNRALMVLREKGFVFHEKYEYVELTPQGAMIAERIYERHKLLVKFFSKILNVSPELASKDGCNIEHYLSEESFKKLSLFVEFLEDRHPNIVKEWHQHLLAETSEGSDSLKLSDLKKGESATIRKIKAKASLKRKFLSMGLIPGEKVVVERVAPFGDPTDIVIKGYHLSLRKEEADQILIERDIKS